MFSPGKRQDEDEMGIGFVASPWVMSKSLPSYHVRLDEKAGS